MAKIVATDLTDLGFVKEQFAFTDPTFFTTYLTGVIAESAIDLEAVITTAVYNNATEPIQSYVKRAEKYLTASELWKRRANIVLKSPGNLDRQSLAASEENKQSNLYREEAEKFIQKLTSGAGIASSTTGSSHFVEPTV